MYQTAIAQEERRINQEKMSGCAVELMELVEAVAADLSVSAEWPKFEFGPLVVGELAKRDLEEEDIVLGIVAHGLGAWGCLPERDVEDNEQALEQGGSLVSRYYSRTGRVFWVRTEWDRSATTVFCPLEC